MKILIASHLYPNPAEPLKGVFVLELAKALTQIVQMEVLAPVSWIPFFRNRRGIPRLENSQHLRVHHPRYLGLPIQLANQRWRPYYLATKNFVQDSGFRPDIIHCHWLYPDACAVSKWAKSLNIAVVATIHGHAAIGLGMGGFQSKFYREALHALDHVIVVSSELQQIVTTQMQVPSSKVTVVLNGIDPQKFQRGSREAARKRLGLALNQKMILSVARLSQEKRLDLLIDAVSRCINRDFQVCLAGEGPLHRDLSRQILHHGLQNRIQLLGGIPHAELPLWYQAADVVCLSSAHEGCPVVIHEALACGIPVVSTRVGSVPDLIVGPQLGLLSAPGEAAALAENLDTALRYPWDHDAIAALGRQYTWSAVAESTLRKVYEPLHQPGTGKSKGGLNDH